MASFYNSKSGEIATLLVVGGLILLGVGTVATSYLVNRQKVTVNSRAAEQTCLTRTQNNNDDCLSGNTGAMIGHCVPQDGKWYRCDKEGSNNRWYGPVDDQALCESETICTDTTASNQSAPASSPGGTCGGVKTGYGNCSAVSPAGTCVYRSYSQADPHYFNQWIYCCGADNFWYAKDSNSQDPAKGWQQQNECVSAEGPAASATVKTGNTSAAIPGGSTVTAQSKVPSGCSGPLNLSTCNTNNSNIYSGNYKCNPAQTYDSNASAQDYYLCPNSSTPSNSGSSGGSTGGNLIPYDVSQYINRPLVGSNGNSSNGEAVFPSGPAGSAPSNGSSDASKAVNNTEPNVSPAANYTVDNSCLRDGTCCIDYNDSQCKQGDTCAAAITDSFSGPGKYKIKYTTATSQDCYDTYPALRGTRMVKPLQNNIGRTLSGLYCKYTVVQGDNSSDCYSQNPLDVLAHKSGVALLPVAYLQQCPDGILCSLPPKEPFVIKITLNKSELFNSSTGINPSDYLNAGVLIEGDVHNSFPGFTCVYDYAKVENGILYTDSIDGIKSHTNDNNRISDFHCVLNQDDTINISGNINSSVLKNYFQGNYVFFTVNVFRELANQQSVQQIIPIFFRLNPNVQNPAYSYTINSTNLGDQSANK